MPNSYHYFESGEISSERFFLEIELFKRCEPDELKNIDWSGYDTPFLRSLAQIGIVQVDDELIKRETKQTCLSEQEEKQQFFIEQCRQRSIIVIDEHPKMTKRSCSLIFNMIFIIIYLHVLGGYLLHEYLHYHGEHSYQQSLNYPLTARRRHLSFADDFFIVILTFTLALIVACVIVATRFNRWILLLAMIIAIILLLIGSLKAKQIIAFLSKFREVRWPTLFDYIYS